MASRGWSTLSAVIVAVALVALVGFPLFELGREVVLAGWSRVAPAIDAAVGEPMLNTLWTSALATIGALAIATSVAVGASGFSARGRTIVLMAMVAPILVPPFVSALSWGAAYGSGGLLDDLVSVALPGLYGPSGVVLVLTVSALPIAYIVVAAALEARQEHDLVRAARVAGAGPADAFRTITAPLLRPAFAAAGAVTFIMSANAFGVPVVLGTPAGFPTATTRLYRDLALSADAASFDRVLVLALFLVLVTFLAVGALDRSRRSALRLRVEPSGPASPSRERRSLVAWGIGILTMVTTGLPLLALVLTGLTRAPGLAAVPGNWTLDHFAAAIDDRAGSAFGTSLVLAFGAALVATALGGMLVAAERRRRSRRGTVAALAFAVPGSVLAVAMLLAYGPWLRDSVLIVLIAYVAKFWALGHRPIAGAADAVSPELVGAARLSGASGPDAVRSIVVPLLRPAVVAAFLVVFMFGLHELTMSSLLHGPGTTTLAVSILDLQQLGDRAVMAALATLLTAGAALCAVPAIVLWRRSAQGRAR